MLSASKTLLPPLCSVLHEWDGVTSSCAKRDHTVSRLEGVLGHDMLVHLYGHVVQQSGSLLQEQTLREKSAVL